MKDCLFIIPARAGSKGIPGKNIKVLGDKPLVQYSIEYARHFVDDKQICVSTNDDKLLDLSKKLKLEVPFKRPEILSSDTASADEVIKHAIDHYRSKGLSFNKVIYLQPTSPFRKHVHLNEALNLFESGSYDMVVSVCESHQNPYFSLFEENKEGFLGHSKQLPTNITRRQDAPKTYQYNGSIYIIGVNSLLKTYLYELKRVKKYVMEPVFALDIDTELDWKYAEFLLENNLVPFDQS